MADTGNRWAIRSLTAVLLLSCTNGAARAAGLDLANRFGDAISVVQQGLDVLWPDDWAKKGVSARLGVGFGWVPDYSGSDNYRFRALPILDIRYKDIMRLSGSMLSYNFYSKDGLEAGPLLNLRFGREENANKALEGLGDIHTTFEVGGIVRYRTDRMLLTADIRQALGAGQGLSVQATAGHGLYKQGPLALSAGLRAKWYSTKAMQTNYGITPDQAANSARGLEAFDADAGISEISLQILGAYQMTESYRLLGLVSYGKLLGDAADSPLSGGGYGSSSQAIVGAAVSFQF